MILKQIRGIQKTKEPLSKSIIDALKRKDIVNEYNKNNVVHIFITVIFR